MASGALQGAGPGLQSAWKIIQRRRGCAGGELQNFVQLCSRQSSNQLPRNRGHGHRGGTEQGQGRGKGRICQHQYYCQEMHVSHISWAPQSHLDTGIEVLSRELAISLSRPHTSMLCSWVNCAVSPTLKDFLSSGDSLGFKAGSNLLCTSGCLRRFLSTNHCVLMN